MNRNVAPPRTNFSAAEDALLVEIVNKMSDIDWKAVAELLGSRTARQCRERYHNYLAPEVSVKDWSPEDDRLLEEQYEIYGPQWAKMRASFPGRSCVNIKNRWAKLSAQRRKHPELMPEPQTKAGSLTGRSGNDNEKFDIEQLFTSIPRDDLFFMLEFDGLQVFEAPGKYF